MPLASPPTPVVYRCSKCSQPLTLADKIWDMETKRFIRIFKCKCGALIWDD